LTPLPSWKPSKEQGLPEQLGVTPLKIPLKQRCCVGRPEYPWLHFVTQLCPCVTPAQLVLYLTLPKNSAGMSHLFGVQLG